MSERSKYQMFWVFVWFGLSFLEEVNLGKRKKKSSMIPNEGLGIILGPELLQCLPGAAAQMACACAGPPAMFPAAHDAGWDAWPVYKQK